MVRAPDDITWKYKVSATNILHKAVPYNGLGRTVIPPWIGRPTRWETEYVPLLGWSPSPHPSVSPPSCSSGDRTPTSPSPGAADTNKKFVALFLLPLLFLFSSLFFTHWLLSPVASTPCSISPFLILLSSLDRLIHPTTTAPIIDSPTRQDHRQMNRQVYSVPSLQTLGLSILPIPSLAGPLPLSMHCNHPRRPVGPYSLRPSSSPYPLYPSR